MCLSYIHRGGTSGQCDTALAVHLDDIFDTHSKAEVPFEIVDGLIYHINRTTGLRRLAIPKSCVKEIFEIAHGNIHLGFQRTYDKVNAAYYIRNLSKQLSTFISHCPECLRTQTRRHKPYGKLQPILSPPILFHMITLDFILATPTSYSGKNCILSVTCKTSKRVLLVPGKAN